MPDTAASKYPDNKALVGAVHLRVLAKVGKHWNAKYSRPANNTNFGCEVIRVPTKGEDICEKGRGEPTKNANKPSDSELLIIT